ncbi:hypothetical protein Zmor_011634 [Zophobas morio]|uniref:Dehydrogenase/reductase SDR family member 11 n=1 Tax=Zophobas morio TaxID=2755281 RepID=A0AA38IRR0_9CUCU|nr:hypothetical protein Zmor_011634 [Zophobas morio]
MGISMDRWKGKTAIVIGASSGIGAAIADALVQHGLMVVAVARRVEIIAERAKNLSRKSGKLYAFKADITKEEDVLKIFKWSNENLGPVHILINSAGKVAVGTFTKGKTEDWKSVFDVNVLGLCTATREAVKIMKENKINGHIIHVNSVLGHQVPNALGLNIYPASKHSVTALAETLRFELNTFGLKIKVTSISPGFVETEMTTLNKDLPPARKALFESIPSLKSEDIADGVIYVLSTSEHVEIQELIIRPLGEKI